MNFSTDDGGFIDKPFQLVLPLTEFFDDSTPELANEHAVVKGGLVQTGENVLNDGGNVKNHVQDIAAIHFSPYGCKHRFDS